MSLPLKLNGEPFSREDLPQVRALINNLMAQADALEAELAEATAVEQEGGTDQAALQTTYDRTHAKFLEASKEFRLAKDELNMAQTDLDKRMAHEGEMRAQMFGKDSVPCPGDMCARCGQTITKEAVLSLERRIKETKTSLYDLQKEIDSIKKTRDNAQDRFAKAQSNVSILAAESAKLSERIDKMEIAGSVPSARPTTTIRAEISDLHKRIKTGKAVVKALEEVQ